MRVRIQRVVPATAGVVVVVVLAAACGAGAPATPPSPIPRIDKPRDVVAVSGRPCSLLSTAQAEQFGLDRPGQPMSGLGRSPVDCEWRNSKGDVWVYVSTSAHESTVEGVYARRAKLPAFELTNLAGYPATATRTDGKRPACDVDLKAADGQSVTVSYDAAELDKMPQRGCAVAKEVALAVLQNLPAKRG